jgi:hypothetical protein
MSAIANPVHRTPSHEARAHILAAALGVAVTIAVDKAVEEGWDWPRIIALSAFLITAVIFTMAMIQVAQDRQYVNWLAEHHWFAACDLLSDVATGVLLIVMAFNLASPTGLLLTNLLFRGVDLLTDIFIAGRAKNSWAGTWIIADSIAIASFLVVAMALTFFDVEDSQRLWVISVVFFVLTIVDTAIDIRNNGSLYFGTPAAT